MCAALTTSWRLVNSHFSAPRRRHSSQSIFGILFSVCLCVSLIDRLLHLLLES